MGLGDDLIFLGKAEEVHKQTGKKIVPVYGSGWSPLFDNVDFLTRDKTEDSITVNARDTDQPSDVHIDYYLKHKKRDMLGERLIYRNFKPSPFRIRLTEKELEQAKDRVEALDLDRFCIVNPDYKSSFFSKNKNWGFEKYQELTDRLSSHIPVIRFQPQDKQYSEPVLDNAINIPGINVRLASAIMSLSSFGVTFDGFVQHAMAGFGRPCVVICGGLVSQKSFGYDNNIYHEYKHPLTPCGSTFDCNHCKEANLSITVDDVFESCLRLLNESSSSHRRI